MQLSVSRDKRYEGLQVLASSGHVVLPQVVIRSFGVVPAPIA
jgi:hypothetical protein